MSNLSVRAVLAHTFHFFVLYKTLLMEIRMKTACKNGYAGTFMFKFMEFAFLYVLRLNLYWYCSFSYAVCFWHIFINSAVHLPNKNPKRNKGWNFCFHAHKFSWYCVFFVVAFFSLCIYSPFIQECSSFFSNHSFILLIRPFVFLFQSNADERNENN